MWPVACPRISAVYHRALRLAIPYHAATEQGRWNYHSSAFWAHCSACRPREMSIGRGSPAHDDRPARCTPLQCINLNVPYSSMRPPLSSCWHHILARSHPMHGRKPAVSGHPCRSASRLPLQSSGVRSQSVSARSGHVQGMRQVHGLPPHCNGTQSPSRLPGFPRSGNATALQSGSPSLNFPHRGHGSGVPAGPTCQ